MSIELFLTFLLSLFSAVFVLVTTIRVQESVRRFDDLCDNIRVAADLGVKYWFSDSGDGEESTKVRIIGHQQLISLTLNSLASRFGKSRRQDWARELEPFFDALTGGTFGELGHTSDPSRAQQVQTEMAQLITIVREHQASALRIQRILVSKEIFK